MTYGAIEELLRGVHSTLTSMDQEAIETNSQKPRRTEIAITVVKKRSSRGSIDSLAVERFPAVVEIA